jgi:DNA-binding transcriptional ArsR family regulator
MKITNPVLFAKALADDTRQKIMKLTCCRWLSVTEIVEHTSVTQPTVSHHLAILRDADLVEVREEGKQTYYRLNHENLNLCCIQLLGKFSTDKE